MAIAWRSRIGIAVNEHCADASNWCDISTSTHPKCIVIYNSDTTDLSLLYSCWHFVWSFADSPILQWWHGIHTVLGVSLLLSRCSRRWLTLCWSGTEIWSGCCHRRAVSHLLSRWCKWEGGLWKYRWEWMLGHPLMSAQSWERQFVVIHKGQLEGVNVLTPKVSQCINT